MQAMKRVPVLIPPEMLAWLEAKTSGVENRATFIRRLIAEAMKAEQPDRR
jgi:metal-responsive CopG/Arc/MetJ family transcriptional regulator